MDHARRTLLGWLATLVAAITLLVTSNARAAARVQLTIDPPNPMVGEPFRAIYSVSIRNESGAQVAPIDFGGLELLSDPSPPQLPMMWGGGFALSIDTSTEYVLRAPAPGRYTISGARVIQGQTGRVIAQQAPITIVVQGGGGGSQSFADDAGVEDAPPPPPPDPDAPPVGDLTGADYNPNAFLRAAVDDPSPYLGQQITLRVWLYVASSEANCEITDEPTLPGFWNETLVPQTRECASRWFTTNVGGRYMSVGLVRKIALFPSQTGRLTIGPVRANVEMVSGGIFRAMQRLEARSPSIYVDVREPPAAGRPADYVPGTIGPVQLTAEVDRTSGAVGETFAFTVRAMSEGSLASTSLTIPSNIDGLRIRSGDAHATHDTSSGRVVSTLENEILVVPERPGRFDLGAVQVPYWDPQRNAYDVARAVLPVINVTGAPLARDDTQERGQDPQSELEPLIASPSLRPHRTWFQRGALPLATIAFPPLALIVGASFASLVRALRKRRSEREDEKRTDPIELASQARREVPRDRAKGISIAGRALDRALAAYRSEHEGSLTGLSAATRTIVDEARAACDAARFAGADADAEDLVAKVDRAVRALEDAS
jgi:hypothetical protein